MPLTIYRIETPAGRGPYYDPERGKDARWFAHAPETGCQLNETRHPSPLEDEGILERMEAFFRIPDRRRRYGFASPDQYRNWFHTPAARAGLKRAGYKLVEYEVPESRVVVGTAQVVFDKRLAKKKRERSCVTWHI